MEDSQEKKTIRKFVWDSALRLWPSKTNFLANTLQVIFRILQLFLRIDLGIYFCIFLKLRLVLTSTISEI